MKWLNFKKKNEYSYEYDETKWNIRERGEK